MIQRATLLKVISHENEAIQDYILLVKLANNEHERHKFKHALKEEREHKVMLENVLKNYVVRKGQTNITDILLGR